MPLFPNINYKILCHFLYIDRLAATKSPDVLRQQLKMAVQENDQPNLEKVIIECEKAEYPELGYDLLDARETYKKLSGSYGG